MPREDYEPALSDSESQSLVPMERMHDNVEPDQHQAEEGLPEFMDEDEDLAYSAAHVTSILKPVTLTMALVVWLVRILGRNSTFAGQNPYRTWMVYKEEETDAVPEKLGGAVLNALVFVGFIMAFTCVFVLLYKFRCMKIIYGWLCMSVFVLLAGSGSVLTYTLIEHFQLPVDYYTFMFVGFNFATVGTVAIFYHAPMIVKQAYLVAASVIMAWVLTKLPSWTNWCLLAALALYDIGAVLAPCGPLKALVEMSQDRNEPIPGLVYEAEAPARQQRPGLNQIPPPHARDDGDDDADNDGIPMLALQRDDLEAGAPAAQDEPEQGAPQLPGQGHQEPVEDDDDEDRAVKLGLGDFVFYSVLVGRAADNDVTTVVACFVAILTGLCATLFLLAMYRKALPALPFSIFLGMIFYFLTSICLGPLVTTFARLQLYV